MKKPTVVHIEHRKIWMIRRSGRHSVLRWYITLDFGGRRKKLAVSAKVVRWLRK